ncbi:MAG TPA: hypothetical protein VGO58_02365, partial [Chitinophagaceae bacterium]|nr:hypothetical protein [Chitinophagaceae bacterium]
MVKQLLPALAFLVVLSSCSTFKPLNFTSNRQVNTMASPVSSKGGSSEKTKFIDDISMTPQVSTDRTTTLKPEPQVATNTTRGLASSEAPV